jgi:two-component system, LytTR family, sensor kinase
VSVVKTPDRSSLRWPRLRLRPALVLLGAALVLGVWQGVTVVLAMRNDHDATPWREPMMWELTGALSAALCIWIPMAAVLTTPRPAGRWGRFAATHVIAYVVFSAVKTPLMLGARYALYPLIGWGPYCYSFWAGHLAMEAMKDGLAYGVIATAYSLYRASRERQERALREAQLVSELRETRLQALQGQLNPHFLMNALNTISAVMFQDLARTDRLLDDLGAVLRAGFDAGHPSWSLAEERAHTARFVALLEARFADRLRVSWQVPAALDGVAVPRFALQLLVENAVKHNQDRPQGLVVRIEARRVGPAVELLVDDDGRGFADASPARGAGRGLRHLDEVLRLLYGARGELAREASPSGGARVRVRVPIEGP